MLSTFSTVSKNFKLKPQIYTIDTVAAKFHYRLTTIFFVIATIIVTSNQYIGAAINCIANGVPPHVVNTYCFISSTYTVAKYHNTSLVKGGEISHLGVGSHNVFSDEPIIRHAYYQWVPFVLFFQALMFYAPRFIWKRLEGKAIENLVGGLKYARFALLDKGLKIGTQDIPSKQSKDDALQQLQKIFFQHSVINNLWAYKMLFCELLYVINLVLQYFIIDAFLGGQFFSLGKEIMASGQIPLGVLEKVFPKVTKCNFYKYGPSGSLQFHDAMCVMAMNIVNEKIYAFLWFWFIILAIVSGLGILFHIISFILHARSATFNKWVFNARSKSINPWQYFTVTNNSNYSDWLFMYYCSKNLDGLTFQDLFVKIAKKLDTETADDNEDKTKLIDLP